MVKRAFQKLVFICLTAVLVFLPSATTNSSPSQRRADPAQGGRTDPRRDPSELVRNCKPNRVKPCQPTNGTANCLGCEREAMESARKGHEETLALLDAEQQQVERHYQSDMQSWRGRNPDLRKAIQKRYTERLKDIEQSRSDARRSFECIKEYVNTGCCGNLKGQYWEKRCDEYVKGKVEGRVEVPPRSERPRVPPPRDPLGFPSADAETYPPPTVAYRCTGNRILLFVNNPEQIKEAEDFADKDLGHHTIFEETVSGSARVFFEHTNRSGFPIRYGVQLFNPNKTAVRVTLEGSGFIANSYGGEPFRQLFTQRQARVQMLGPQQSLWLLNSSAPIPNRAFLSGVADFSVSGGRVVLTAFAYRNAGQLDGKSTYQGYITRQDYDPVTKRTTDESRLYKGTMACAELVADGVNFVFDDSHSGALEVQFQSRRGEIKTATGWNTHTLGNPEALQGDMLDIRMPEGTIIRATGHREANLGNWGVVYTLRGQVKNNGKRARCVSISLEPTSRTETASIAWRERSGVWRADRLAVLGRKAYYQFLAPAGEIVSYETSMVLGGPSSTNLRHTVSVLDSAQCR